VQVHLQPRTFCVSLNAAGLPASLTPGDLQAGTTDDANLAWRVARQQQLTAWGSDLFCPCPAPMFQLQLLLRGDELLFVPGLQEVQHTVLGIVDAILQTGQSVEDLGAKVNKLHCCCWLLLAWLPCCAVLLNDTLYSLQLTSTGTEMQQRHMRLLLNCYVCRPRTRAHRRC
jgi:hypothetical protein